MRDGQATGQPGQGEHLDSAAEDPVVSGLVPHSVDTGSWEELALECVP